MLPPSVRFIDAHPNETRLERGEKKYFKKENVKILAELLSVVCLWSY